MRVGDVFRIRPSGAMDRRSRDRSCFCQAETGWGSGLLDNLGGRMFMRLHCFARSVTMGHPGALERDGDTFVRH